MSRRLDISSLLCGGGGGSDEQPSSFQHASNPVGGSPEHAQQHQQQRTHTEPKRSRSPVVQQVILAPHLQRSSLGPPTSKLPLDTPSAPQPGPIEPTITANRRASGLSSGSGTSASGPPTLTSSSNTLPPSSSSPPSSISLFHPIPPSGPPLTGPRRRSDPQSYPRPLSSSSSSAITQHPPSHPPQSPPFPPKLPPPQQQQVRSPPLSTPHSTSFPHHPHTHPYASHSRSPGDATIPPAFAATRKNVSPGSGNLVSPGPGPPAFPPYPLSPSQRERNRDLYPPPLPSASSSSFTAPGLHHTTHQHHPLPHSLIQHPPHHQQREQRERPQSSSSSSSINTNAHTKSPKVQQHGHSSAGGGAPGGFLGLDALVHVANAERKRLSGGGTASAILPTSRQHRRGSSGDSALPTEHLGMTSPGTYRQPMPPIMTSSTSSPAGMTIHDDKAARLSPIEMRSRASSNASMNLPPHFHTVQPPPPPPLQQQQQQQQSSRPSSRHSARSASSSMTMRPPPPRAPTIPASASSVHPHQQQQAYHDSLPMRSPSSHDQPHLHPHPQAHTHTHTLAHVHHHHHPHPRMEREVESGVVEHGVVRRVPSSEAEFQLQQQQKQLQKQLQQQQQQQQQAPQKRRRISDEHVPHPHAQGHGLPPTRRMSQEEEERERMRLEIMQRQQLQAQAQRRMSQEQEEEKRQRSRLEMMQRPQTQNATVWSGRDRPVVKDVGREGPMTARQEEEEEDPPNAHVLSVGGGAKGFRGPGGDAAILLDPERKPLSQKGDRERSILMQQPDRGERDVQMHDLSRSQQAYHRKGLMLSQSEPDRRDVPAALHRQPYQREEEEEEAEVENVSRRQVPPSMVLNPIPHVATPRTVRSPSSHGRPPSPSPIPALALRQQSLSQQHQQMHDRPTSPISSPPVTRQDAAYRQPHAHATHPRSYQQEQEREQLLLQHQRQQQQRQPRSSASSRQHSREREREPQFARQQQQQQHQTPRPHAADISSPIMARSISSPSDQRTTYTGAASGVGERRDDSIDRRMHLLTQPPPLEPPSQQRQLHPIGGERGSSSRALDPPGDRRSILNPTPLPSSQSMEHHRKREDGEDGSSQPLSAPVAGLTVVREKDRRYSDPVPAPGFLLPAGSSRSRVSTPFDAYGHVRGGPLGASEHDGDCVGESKPQSARSPVVPSITSPLEERRPFASATTSPAGTSHTQLPSLSSAVLGRAPSSVPREQQRSPTYPPPTHQAVNSPPTQHHRPSLSPTFQRMPTLSPVQRYPPLLQHPHPFPSPMQPKSMPLRPFSRSTQHDDEDGAESGPPAKKRRRSPSGSDVQTQSARSAWDRKNRDEEPATGGSGHSHPPSLEHPPPPPHQPRHDSLPPAVVMPSREPDGTLRRPGSGRQDLKRLNVQAQIQGHPSSVQPPHHAFVPAPTHQAAPPLPPVAPLPHPHRFAHANDIAARVKDEADADYDSPKPMTVEPLRVVVIPEAERQPLPPPKKPSSSSRSPVRPDAKPTPASKSGSSSSSVTKVKSREKDTHRTHLPPPPPPAPARAPTPAAPPVEEDAAIALERELEDVKLEPTPTLITPAAVATGTGKEEPEDTEDVVDFLVEELLDGKSGGDRDMDDGASTTDIGVLDIELDLNSDEEEGEGEHRHAKMDVDADTEMDVDDELLSLIDDVPKRKVTQPPPTTGVSSGKMGVVEQTPDPELDLEFDSVSSPVHVTSPKTVKDGKASGKAGGGKKKEGAGASKSAKSKAGNIKSRVKGTVSTSTKQKLTSKTQASRPSPPVTSPKKDVTPTASTQQSRSRSASVIPSGRAGSSVPPDDEAPMDQDIVEDKDDDDKLYCVCQSRYDEDRVMIACDRCDEWYHTSCVNMSDLEVDLVDQFICPPCVNKYPDLDLKTTWKQRCFRGFNHPDPSSAAACHKPARGAFSKYCSDECGVKYMQSKINAWTKKGGKKEKLWMTVKDSEKRRGVVIPISDPDMKTPPMTSEQLKSSKQAKKDRELRELRTMLDRVVGLREEIKQAMDIVLWREQVLAMAMERADKLHRCGWDHRVCLPDDELVDTDLGQNVLESYDLPCAGEGEDREGARTPEEGEDGMQVDDGDWWCLGMQVCDRHAGWQTLRSKDIALEKTKKEEALTRLTTRERDIRRRIEDVVDPQRGVKSDTRPPPSVLKLNDKLANGTGHRGSKVNGEAKKGKKRKEMAT